MIQVIDKRVLSSDGEHKLAGRVYIPDDNIKGIFHVVHGMTEHIGRYDGFMKQLAELGYLTFGYDHLGHGHTARDESELGFFAYKDGWKRLVDDVALFGNEIKAEYGENLPYYLMGHSMGSFIVRLAAESYDIQDKLIIMGTAGPNPAVDPGLLLINTIKKKKGDKAYSNTVEKLIFGNYNKKFGNDSPYDWLSSSEECRAKYGSDPLCNFRFTVSAMGDVVRLTKECNTKRWFNSCVTKKPILLISGSDDPVGDYGKGVKKVYDNLKANHADVKFKLYGGSRHEILNDISSKKVFKDIVEFIEK